MTLYIELFRKKNKSGYFILIKKDNGALVYSADLGDIPEQKAREILDEIEKSFRELYTPIKYEERYLN